MKNSFYVKLLANCILYLSVLLFFTGCLKDKLNDEPSPSSIFLNTPHAWSLASTPQHQLSSDKFPEAASGTGLAFRKNVARISWYTIDPLFYNVSSLTPDHILNDLEQRSNHFVRGVLATEIWPNITNPPGAGNHWNVLNIAYYPEERGSYNYDSSPTQYSKGIDINGKLADPTTRWGGIMRNLPWSEPGFPLYDKYNMGAIEFWLMDPFVYESGHSGGDLYINIGYISEDVLRDGRMSIENGLPISAEVIGVDTTIWGRVPVNLPYVNAFHNDPYSIQYQDVGFDGLGNDDERLFFYDSFLSIIKNMYGAESVAYENAFNDPSADDYHYYRSSQFDLDQVSILDRYKRYIGMEGNSKASGQSPEPYPTASSISPDTEDINRNLTLDVNEGYFQYRISLRPTDMQTGNNYIVEVKESNVLLANNATETIKWYLFRIPINSSERETFGAITNSSMYHSMRIFFKNFNEPIICRLATLNLVLEKND